MHKSTQNTLATAKQHIESTQNTLATAQLHLVMVTVSSACAHNTQIM